MKIITREFTLTKNVLFKILFNRQLRRSWPAILLILFVSSFAAESGIAAVILVFLLLLIPLIMYYLVSCFISVRVTANKIFYAPRICEMDHEYLSTQFSDGSQIKIRFDKFHMIIQNKKFYLFFYSVEQFIYLPVSAFNAPSDHDSLKVILRVKAA